MARIARVILALALALSGLMSPALTHDAQAATPTCGGLRATIVGTAGADRLVGTTGRDVIVGRGGADTIVAKGGDDRVCGGPGNDAIDGGAGRDRCYGGTGTDSADNCQVLVAAENRGRVLPVLFVPANIPLDPDWRPAIETGMATVAAWYDLHSRHRTFDIGPVQVVRGLHDHDWYCPKTKDDDQCIQVPWELGADSEDVWRVVGELEERGIEEASGTVIAIFWASAYGYAGGWRRDRSRGGFAVGDHTLYGITGGSGDAAHCGQDGCHRARQLGTIAHELGHALGLPHPSEDGLEDSDPESQWNSVMSGDFRDFPDTGIVETAVNPERTTLAGSRVLHDTDRPTCPDAPPTTGLRPFRVTTAILCDAGDMHLYFFSGRKDQRVRLLAGGLPPAMPRITLMTCCSDDGTVLATSPDARAVASMTLPYTGTYAVRLESATGKGIYALELQVR